ncbi:lipid II flippase MurJ [Pseudaeromonas sp. ZJS20]|uniref:murein biosynthesis integral membrane protein MurJ n=1 Tax=Pseudaeromonas aegiceratis TaxID=3153928 RepID=UPI00390C8A01
MRSNIIKLFSGNFISKILGFAREVIFAGTLGTGAEIGAYRVAQTGTLVPINFLTSDSLNSAFIPLYIKFRNGPDGEHVVSLYTWVMLALFSAFSILLTLIVLLGSYFWVSILAPGLDDKVKELASTMLDIMGYGIPAYIVSVLGVFICIANDDFVPMALRPSIQNVGLLAGALLFLLFGDPAWLAWGFTISYGFFFLYITFRLLNRRFIEWPKKWCRLDVKLIVNSFWCTIKPLLLLPVLSQGNIAVERAVASLVGLVAVSALDYAKFTTETIFFLISMPVAFVGLSSWSGLDNAQVKERIANTAKAMLFIAVPLSSIVGQNASLIVDVMFSRGQFDAASASVTTSILVGMSFGIWAQAIGYVLIKGLSATFKNNVVLMVMAVSLVINSIFNLIFYKHFGAITLGLANSIYAIVLFFLCVRALDLWCEIKGDVLTYLIGSLVLFIISIFLSCAFNYSKFTLLFAACLYWIVFSFLYRPASQFFFRVMRLRR